MININISCDKTITQEELVEIFIKKKIQCRITSTISSVPNEKGEYSIEYGFNIIILGIDGHEFKDQIWNELQEKLGVKCAFVRYNHEYMGCVQNWPGVFCDNNCCGSLNS